jgi:hypothetical protein
MKAFTEESKSELDTWVELPVFNEKEIASLTVFYKQAKEEIKETTE